MKELARISSLGGSKGPVPERRSSGGVAFTAGEVSAASGFRRLENVPAVFCLRLEEQSIDRWIDRLTAYTNPPKINKRPSTAFELIS